MDSAVIDTGLLFDYLLAALILWLGWRALTSQSLFRAIVLFVAFGLSMALAWVRLDAPDVALAEIAVSAGLTGALLLAAFGGVHRTGESDKRRGELAARKQLARERARVPDLLRISSVLPFEYLFNCVNRTSLWAGLR